MRQKYKRWLMNMLGYSFLILGIIGCFTPILQGFLFIFIGLAILSKSAPWAKNLLIKFREKNPKIAEKADQFMEKFIWRSKNT